MTAARLHTAQTTIGIALAQATRRLAAAGVESARLDARLLVAAATGESVAMMIAWPERALAPREVDRLEAMVARRCARVPVAQILGLREFWSLEVGVSPAVLTPRPDSETVVEAVLEHFTDRSAALRLLDLGTGSGCLLLALLHEYPAACGFGSDISEPAAALARANAERLGLGARASFWVGDWTRGISGEFDAIVCNPPYIASGAIESLESEVARHEPRAALDGGPDGLSAYRTLLPLLPARLAENGIAVCEVGLGQTAAVGRLAQESGLSVLGQRTDLAGISRVAILRQPIQ